MRTEPLMWAEAALGGDATSRDVVLDHCVLVGSRPEVDVDALSEVDPVLGQRVKDFCARVREGVEPGFVGLVVEHVQVTGGAGKSDLREVYECLLQAPGTGVLVGELLSSDPDLDVVRGVTESLGGEVDSSDGLVCTVWFEPEGWDTVLGGVPWPGEYSRGFRIEAAHAKWRDRSVRRLARVQVLAACA